MGLLLLRCQPRDHPARESLRVPQDLVPPARSRGRGRKWIRAPACSGASARYRSMSPPPPWAVFATGQSVRPGPGRGRTTFRRPVRSFPELARQARAKDQDGRHSVVPHRPPPSPPSPAVLCSYLPSPGRSCPRSWGSSSLLMTAVLGIQGRGRTTFCRPVSSGGLGSPPAGPYGGPGRLRTLALGKLAASPMTLCTFST